MEELRWILDMNQLEEKVMKASQKGQHSIYKVPAYLSDLNSKAYVPQIVSFGPYHHGDSQCNPMHKHKLRALSKFVKRSGKPIESYKRELEKVVNQLMDSYDEIDGTNWASREDDFLALMILDGVFMLEIMHTATDSSNDYPHDDPIFSVHGKLYYVPFFRRDMLLVQNQIPMLVLNALIAVRDYQKPQLEEEGNKVEAQVGKKTQDVESSSRRREHKTTTPTYLQIPPKVEESLKKLILKFFNIDDKNFCSSKEAANCLHLLDLYRKTMLVGGSPTTTTQTKPSSSSSSEEAGRPNYLEIMKSATELRESGVHFRELPPGQKINHIRFERGVLSLPTLVVDDHTESIFLNLMAFERLHVGTRNEIASYICFMDSIIDTAPDVAVLSSNGIIQNATGSNKAVASLFNQLSKEVPLEAESSLRDVEKNVNVYCKKKRHRWLATLRQNYLQHPWAWISVIAAIFLLLLTVLQTVYSVLDFYRK